MEERRTILKGLESVNHIIPWLMSYRVSLPAVPQGHCEAYGNSTLRYS